MSDRTWKRLEHPTHPLGDLTVTVIEDRVVVELVARNMTDSRLFQVPLTDEAEKRIEAALGGNPLPHPTLN